MCNFRGCAAGELPYLGTLDRRASFRFHAEIYRSSSLRNDASRLQGFLKINVELQAAMIQSWQEKF